jgi:hypothetical protein
LGPLAAVTTAVAMAGAFVLFTAPTPAPPELGGLLLMLAALTLAVMVPLVLAVAAPAAPQRRTRRRLEATAELAGVALMGSLLLVAAVLV